MDVEDIVLRTTDRAIQIHDAIIEMSNGLQGIRDVNALESAMAQPYQSAFGTELHPTTLEKCAALGFYITANHPFIDGNKRTAFVVMLDAMASSGITLSASEDKLYDLLIAIASSRMSLEEMVDTLETLTRSSSHRLEGILEKNREIILEAFDKPFANNAHHL